MSRKVILLALIAGMSVEAAPGATPVLTEADEIAAFKAAGFQPTGGRYLMCDEQNPLGIEARDINGDGRIDAVITDGGLACYGQTETGFTVLTKDAGGAWHKLYASPGVPNFLKTRAEGWPEIEIGGPGFCFPVVRWNGKTFVENRHQYEGKPCRPQ